MYLWSFVENKSVVSLVCEKTRVTPIKSLTIPRFELLGAKLLAKLLNKVRGLLNIYSNHIYAFSDSQVALVWIKGPADNF